MEEEKNEFFEYQFHPMPKQEMAEANMVMMKNIDKKVDIDNI